MKRTKRWLKGLILFYITELRYWFKRKETKPFQICFIIGCGRSGTTAFGKAIAKHPEIAYLNERRFLWFRSYPMLDIGSRMAYWRKNGVVFADERLVSAGKSYQLREDFYKVQVAEQKSWLLEKLPTNSFRLPFIHAIFPEAKFIYLHRNGLEVAHSIVKRMPFEWFGYKEIKLELLKKYALAYPEYARFIPELTTNLRKAMLEWRLSMDASHRFFSNLPNDKFISLSYEDFVNQPALTAHHVYEFLGLPATSELTKELENSIQRHSQSLAKDNVSDDLLITLGGELLEQTIANTYLK